MGTESFSGYFIIRNFRYRPALHVTVFSFYLVLFAVSRSRHSCVYLFEILARTSMEDVDNTVDAFISLNLNTIPDGVPFSFL